VRFLAVALLAAFTAFTGCEMRPNDCTVMCGAVGVKTYQEGCGTCTCNEPSPPPTTSPDASVR
jgi:hypothetical protein